MQEGLAREVGAPDKGKNRVAKIIGIMFMSRTAAHISHLATQHYGHHKVLNKFYDEVIDASDEIAEVAQGIWGRLSIPFEGLDGDVNEPVRMLAKHLSEIEELAKGCGQEALNGPLTDAIALYRKTLYLLSLK